MVRYYYIYIYIYILYVCMHSHTHTYLLYACIHVDEDICIFRQNVGQSRASENVYTHTCMHVRMCSHVWKHVWYIHAIVRRCTQNNEKLSTSILYACEVCVCVCVCLVCVCVCFVFLQMEEIKMHITNMSFISNTP